MKFVPKNIETVRKRHGFSQTKLVEKMGVKDRSSISRYESGQTPTSLNTLQEMADAMNISILEFFEDVPSINRSPKHKIPDEIIEFFPDLENYLNIGATAIRKENYDYLFKTIETCANDLLDQIIIKRNKIAKKNVKK